MLFLVLRFRGCPFFFGVCILNFSIEIKYYSLSLFFFALLQFCSFAIFGGFLFLAFLFFSFAFLSLSPFFCLSFKLDVQISLHRGCAGIRCVSKSSTT